MPTAQPDLVTTLTGFTHALRDAGVAADRVRLATCLTALAHVDPHSLGDVYWVARLSLCSEPDDAARFDPLFDLWFRGRLPAPDVADERPTAMTLRPTSTGSDSSRTEGDAAEEEDVLRAAAADTEVLRHRDVALLDDRERSEINRLIALLRPRLRSRPTLRRERDGSRRIDVRRTVRDTLRNGGEPRRLLRSDRRHKPRRLVLLLDVSGSMTPYAEVLLRFGHAAVRAAPNSTEVFTLGTRLTRVTRQLRIRDPDLALHAAGRAVPDWSGGTRLGETVRAFLDRWGQRGTARRAVVVLASDGWERGDPTLLGEQMRRLARLAHRVVWVNPHRGKHGFAPATGGMVAALPAIDDLVAGHSFAALRNLAEVIARA